MLLLPFYILSAHHVRHDADLIWLATWIALSLTYGLLWGHMYGKRRDKARSAAVGSHVEAYPAAAQALASGRALHHSIREAAVRLGTYRVEHLRSKVRRPARLVANGIFIVVAIVVLVSLGISPALCWVCGVMMLQPWFEPLTRPLRRARALQKLQLLEGLHPQMPSDLPPSS